MCCALCAFDVIEFVCMGSEIKLGDVRGSEALESGGFLTGLMQKPFTGMLSTGSDNKHVIEVTVLAKCLTSSQGL